MLFRSALEDDLIAAVGTYFDSEGVDYEFDIYVNGVLKHTQNGVSPFAGYHTIKLTQYIPISANDTFKVVFKNSSLPFEYNSRHHHKENVSFGSVDGVNWEDLAKDNVTAILKVYTVAKPVVPPTPVVPSKPLSQALRMLSCFTQLAPLIRVV